MLSEYLQRRRAGVSAPDGIETRERTLGPDDEAAEVSSRSELKQVQALHVSQLHARDVTESLTRRISNNITKSNTTKTTIRSPETYQLDVIIGVIDDQRAATSDVAAIAHLALTSADLGGFLRAGNILVRLQLLEKLDGGIGLRQVLQLQENQEIVFVFFVLVFAYNYIQETKKKSKRKGKLTRSLATTRGISGTSSMR